MLCTALLAAFGVFALAKGEFNITQNRKVSNLTARVLGGFLLLWAIAGLLLGQQFGTLIQILAFVLVLIVGLILSEKIEP
jgi:uncharacterized membrane protein